MNLWNTIFYLFKLIKEFKESSFLISYAIVLWCLVLNLQTLLCTPVCEAQISGVTLCPGLFKKIPLFLHFKVIANCYQVPWVRVTQRKTSQRDWSAYSQRTETSTTGESLPSSSHSPVAMSIGMGWFPGLLQTPQSFMHRTRVNCNVKLTSPLTLLLALNPEQCHVKCFCAALFKGWWQGRTACIFSV